MARAPTVMRSRWPFGLALAVVGLLVALFAYTGERTYHLGWFYLAVLALALVVVGIGYVGYDRAIRPEVERRRARGLPPPAPFRERARALVQESPSAPAAAETPRHRGKVERVRMSCPACRHVFAAEGVRPIAVSCPRCGLEGDVP